MTTNDPFDRARRVARKLRAEGHRAFFAGGAVRDHLLGLHPHDVDVATSARPEEVTELFSGAQLVGASFGVVIVPAGEGSIEVATFRKEGRYLDGRRPSEVEFASSEEDDVRRRDFTVNGLLLDPETGEVVDLVGGRRDLEAGILRAIGDPEERFREDHLRLLRAARFVAQLGFEVEENTRRSIRELAPLVRRVAPERIRDELTRLLTGPRPERGLEFLKDTGLLAEVLPEVAALHGVDQPPQYHPEGDVLTHTFLLFRHLEKPSAELAFGALLHDVGKAPTFERGPDRIRFPNHAKVGADMTEEICRRLRFPNESRERVVELVRHHMRFLDVRNMKTSTLKRFLRLSGFDEHLALHRADCLASNGLLDNWKYARDRRHEFGEEQLRPPPLATGHDLLALGYEEGPPLGKELRRLEELQLEGTITTPEEAIEQARRDLGSPGGRASLE